MKHQIIIAIMLISLVTFVGVGAYNIGYNSGRRIGQLDMNDANKEAYKTKLRAMASFVDTKDNDKLNKFIKSEIAMCGHPDYVIGRINK